MQLCTDKDLAILEPTLFLEMGFAHLKIVRNSVATIARTTLMTTADALAAVSPGMIALLGSPGQVVEIVELTSTSAAVISILRTVNGAAPIAPGLAGTYELSILSFKPIIEYASQELLESIGAANCATDKQSLVRQAAVCRTLNLLFMALVQGIAPAAESAVNSGNKARNDLLSGKAESYRKQYESLRRQLSLRIDQDGDGNPETPIHGNVIDLWRK